MDAFEAVGTYYNLDNFNPFGDVYNYEAEALGPKDDLQRRRHADHRLSPAPHRQARRSGENQDPRLGRHRQRVPYVFELTRLAVERGMTTQGVDLRAF